MSSNAQVRRRAVQAARDKGLGAAMLDRLALNPQRLANVANALREVAALPDPVGEVTRDYVRLRAAYEGTFAGGYAATNTIKVTEPAAGGEAAAAAETDVLRIQTALAHAGGGRAGGRRPGRGVRGLRTQWLHRPARR